MRAHVTCLGAEFLDFDTTATPSACELLPVSGDCPCCETELQWGELIRLVHQRGSSKGRRVLSQQAGGVDSSLGRPPGAAKSRFKGAPLSGEQMTFGIGDEEIGRESNFDF